MNEVDLKSIVSQAVGEAFEKWATVHPSLAAVIDKSALLERTADSLCQSDEYAHAMKAYQEGHEEMNILGNLIDLAEQIIPLIL